jgi:acetyl-CoA carboxylase biotin carboxyl carrier protein
MAKFNIDTDLVHKLADLLRETGLGEIEYETDGRRVRVALPAGTRTTQIVQAVEEAETNAETNAETSPAGAVVSPMVGTVYLSSSPSEAPFVRAGDRVSEGQTLLLIEAMKTFNEIKADRAGTVTRILVANAQPVEYGEALAIIE